MELPDSGKDICIAYANTDNQQWNFFSLNCFHLFGTESKGDVNKESPWRAYFLLSSRAL